MGKKKHPVTVHLDIFPTSLPKRSEGLDILARLIARNIRAERSPQQKKHNSWGKDK